jgi:hypothetical protein
LWHSVNQRFVMLTVPWFIQMEFLVDRSVLQKRQQMYPPAQ